jgi:hypothetical protein
MGPARSSSGEEAALARRRGDGASKETRRWMQFDRCT